MKLGLPVAAALLFLQAGSWASAPEKAPSPASTSATEGFILSIMSTTQGNFGKLGIGAGYMGGGPYLDEQNVRRNGLHASLSIAVEGEPSLFQQPDVHEGQTLEAAGYRIFVEKIDPGTRGAIVLRLWAPPKPAKHWPFNWFGRSRR